MKKIFEKITLAVAFCVSFSSCNLDEFPHATIALDESLKNIDDLSAWNNNLMSSIRSMQYGSYTQNQELMADVLSPTVTFGNRNGSLYSWEHLNSSSGELNFWDSYYGRLQEPNHIIATIDKIDLSSADATKAETNKVRSEWYLGNAYFCRAYIYTQLALRYAKPYEQSKETDLCVPLMLAYDVNALPQRSTQKEVYDQIFADLDKAESLYKGLSLPAYKNYLAGRPMSQVVTVDAVTALKARTYLYMGKYAEALAEAKKLISTNKYPLVAPAAQNFERMWRLDTSSEDIMVSYIERPDEMPSSGGFYGADKEKKPGVGNIKVNTPDYIPTRWLIDLYDNSDLRKNIYFSNENDAYYNFFYSGVYVVSKFRGNDKYTSNANDDVWGTLPSNVIAPKVFRIAETYLIAAEAAYKTGNTAEATAYLNALRVSRGLTPVATTGEALFTDIKNERTRELAFEGFRLWDLRRWNMPVERRDHQSVNGQSGFLFKGYLNKNIPAGDYRFVWPIPYKDLLVNPNLKGQQNPGW